MLTLALAPRDYIKWGVISLLVSLITMALTLLNAILLSHIKFFADSVTLSLITLCLLTLDVFILHFEHEKVYLYLQRKNSSTALKQCFQTIIKIKPEKLKSFLSGELAQSFSDFERGLGLLADAGLNLLQSIIPLTGLLLYIFICFPSYILPLFIILSLTFTLKLALFGLRFAYTKQLLKHQMSMMTWFTECVQQISLIRLLNMTQPTFHKGMFLFNQLQNIYRKMQCQQIATMLWDYLFVAVLTLFIYLRQESQDLPLLFLTTQLGLYLDRITSNFTLILQGRESVHRLKPIVTLSEPTPAHLITNIPKNTLLQGENLAYQPDNTQTALFKNLNFTIHPGEFVAFVGESGVGKSTLLRLLLGLTTPTHGRVRLNNIDLSYFDMEAWRLTIGTVLQNSQLLNESIYANIVGNTGFGLDEAWALAESVGLADDIRAMPMGIFTRMSDQAGVFVSGGQKQKILLARALAKKPSCLILDEATSALDNQSQAKIQNTLNTLSITRIVVAHRISTIANADVVYQLTQNGLNKLN